MTAICYDTEFLEDGRTIDLISIGMVRGDGTWYYAVVHDDDLISRALAHPWLSEHVIPHLPVTVVCGDAEFRSRQGAPAGWRWNAAHRDYGDVKPRALIAHEVAALITGTPDVELWAWYAAYDHVALCQLWGRMIDLPKGVPMWTNDLKQECQRLGNPALPSLPGVTEHDALDDARECQYRRRWLANYAATSGGTP